MQKLRAVRKVRLRGVNDALSDLPTQAGGFFYVAVRAYFNDVLIDANLVLSFEPIPLTTAIIASEMPAAMRPYSMAVAAVSSARIL
jgi:hypothetical protein